MWCAKGTSLLSDIALCSGLQTPNLRVKCNHDFNYFVLGIILLAEHTKMNKINPFPLKRHWRESVSLVYIYPFVSVTKFPSQILSRQPSLNRAAFKDDSGWMVHILSCSSSSTCLIHKMCGLQQDHKISMSHFHSWWKTWKLLE